MADLTALFLPKSVAVIGASRSPEKVGAIVFKNIVDSGFKGKVYPINPSMEYKDMASLPEIPDLAIVAIPANLVLDTMKQIGEKGTKNVVILTAGFKETGTEGQQLENQLVEIAKQYNISLLGPNCLGFVNNLCPINATFGQQIKSSGNLRFISQSGALATGLFDWCDANGVGFGEFITLGNKAQLSENDCLEYFADSDGPIGMYLESIANGHKFFELTAKLSKKNPIFIIKPGKSQAAAKAMQSHTGAIAGEDIILQTALKQAGIIHCEDLEDFFDLSRALAWVQAPIGPRVAIVSNAGGPAVISADAVSENGLELAQFSPETHEQFGKLLPRAASSGNPVDVLGDALADRYVQASEIALDNTQTDALICILTPQLMTQIEKTAEMIGALGKKYQKPIFCSFIGGSLVAEGEQTLNKYKIPSFRFPERAISTLAKMWKWRQYSLKPAEFISSQPAFQFNLDRAKEVLATAKTENRNTLDNAEANELLLAAGISVPPAKIVADLGQANDFAKSCGWPVVLKLCSPGLLHKTEIGGVITQINSETELEDAWDRLERKTKQLDPQVQKHVWIQVQKEITEGAEVIIGVKYDPTFGPVLLFGAGGKLAELIVDRNLHLLPMNYEMASNLVMNSKIYPLLKGYRGEPALALEKVYDTVVRLGHLAEDLPEIAEIEINPVIVTLNDVWAVDGKVILKSGEAPVVNAPKFYMATTSSHLNPAEKYHEFVFETPQTFNFQPGQYISVKVADNRINAYSIACKIDATHFSLLVDTSPGGVGSKFFEALKVNDKISFLGPFGTFTFKPDDGAQKIVFVGTGSGASALRCMVENILKSTKIPVYFYWGLRYPGDVFWKDVFEKLSQEYPNFKYKLVLSKPDESWTGATGHVTDILKQDFPDTSDASFYLCGNKAMITEVTQNLLSSGSPKERIYFEKFF